LSGADSRFLVLAIHAARMSAVALGELLSQVLGDLGGASNATTFVRWSSN
jgi:hypothetical protein